MLGHDPVQGRPAADFKEVLVQLAAKVVDGESAAALQGLFQLLCAPFRAHVLLSVPHMHLFTFQEGETCTARLLITKLSVSTGTSWVVYTT